MKTIILALLLCLTMPLATGCKTNTAAATVKADKSVVAAANAALNAYADFYVRQKKALAGDQQKLAELEQQRTRVSDAWTQYQHAATALVLAQKANYANPTNVTAQVSGSISALALPVIQLINQLVH